MKAHPALAQVGAILTDTHVVYTSGRHGSAYVNKDALYPHTELTSQCVEAMVSVFVGENVDVVMAPALGGIILSQWGAFHLSRLRGREVLAVYAEKDGDGFVLRRGYGALVAGKRVLVMEDVLTTGGSVKKAVETVKAAGGTVVGVAALCNRGGVTAESLGAPVLRSLMEIQLDTYDPADCPLCRAGKPINTQVGKGKSA